jgi:hypothetical protein
VPETILEKPTETAYISGAEYLFLRGNMASGARLRRFQKKVRGRLRSWKEKDHKADKALRELSQRDR